jgi:anti-sigma regulatory factor (Ser/Thr protein kinase)
VRLRVFPTVEAPSHARRELSLLAADIDSRSLSDVRTVVSELVGMSVANGARKPIEVSLRIEARCIEGIVHDDGTGVRAVGRQESAIVLQILDGLVEEWRADEPEKRIWFRINVRRQALGHRWTSP